MQIRYVLSIVSSAWLACLTGNLWANSNPQQQFINQLRPLVKQANNPIKNKRQRLQKLHQHYQKQGSLKKNNKHWLNQLAHHYDMQSLNWSQTKTWQTLLKRVDIIPSSLVIAQAAIESAWGQSRFAKQANNYFGQHCHEQGCGLVPKKRAKHRSFEVRSFDSKLSSIKSYIHNLNTHHTYQHLRQIRYNLRQQNKPLSGIDIARGLDDYSQSPTYIKDIQSIIRHYNLAQS